MKFFFWLNLLLNSNLAFNFNNMLSRRDVISNGILTNSLFNNNIYMMNNNNRSVILNDEVVYNNPLMLKKNKFNQYIHKKSYLESKSNIYFNGELNDETCLKLSEAIIKHKNNIILNNNEDSHINLYIQSPGGSLLPTLAVVDEILRSEIPIFTYIRGYTASAATLLSVAGKYRIMYNHSLMMIHSVRTEQQITTFADAKDIYNNLNVFMDVIRSIYLDNSKINSELLEKLLIKDSWITSSQALEYGFVDEIL